MKQRIIMIHGRGTKPAKSELSGIWVESLAKGLARAAPAYRRTFEQRSGNNLNVDVIYYGDVTNRILADKSEKHRTRLTETDPSHAGAACLPASGITEALNALDQIGRYTKVAYETVKTDNPPRGVGAEISDLFSALGQIFTLGIANRLLITAAFSDLNAYITDDPITRDIRSRLRNQIKDALAKNEEIILVSHSMGCIVAYDVLWEITRMAEYADIKSRIGNLSKWITIGSPLGEAGVRAVLADRNASREDAIAKYPVLPRTQWINIAAKDDAIAKEDKMRRWYRFKPMERLGLIQSITDRLVYNCYAEGGRSNPHKAFGYTTHADVGNIIGPWIR